MEFMSKPLRVWLYFLAQILVFSLAIATIHNVAPVVLFIGALLLPLAIMWLFSVGRQIRQPDGYPLEPLLQWLRPPADGRSPLRLLLIFGLPVGLRWAFNVRQMGQAQPFWMFAATDWLHVVLGCGIWCILLTSMYWWNARHPRPTPA